MCAGLLILLLGCARVAAGEAPSARCVGEPHCAVSALSNPVSAWTLTGGHPQTPWTGVWESSGGPDVYALRLCPGDDGAIVPIPHLASQVIGMHTRSPLGTTQGSALVVSARLSATLGLGREPEYDPLIVLRGLPSYFDAHGTRVVVGLHRGDLGTWRATASDLSVPLGGMFSIEVRLDDALPFAVRCNPAGRRVYVYQAQRSLDFFAGDTGALDHVLTAMVVGRGPTGRVRVQTNPGVLRRHEHWERPLPDAHADAMVPGSIVTDLFRGVTIGSASVRSATDRWAAKIGGEHGVCPV